MSGCSEDVVNGLFYLLLSIAVVFLFALPVLAENGGISDSSARSSSDASATVVGTVTDVNDNPLEGASVILQELASPRQQTAVSNERGFFEFENVKSGTAYKITVHAQGFAGWMSPEFTPQPRQYKIVTDCQLRLEQTRTTVNVSYSRVEVATEEVAIEEKQRVLGIVPNFYVVYDSHPEPLTAKLKFRLALRVSVDPVTVAGVAFMAGIKQAANTPDYEQGATGYGKRFGAQAGDGLTDIMIGETILPSVLHQDPRYFYQGTGTKKSRIFHAISAPFVCKGDDGRLQPNYSSIGGDLASSAISNAYYPRSNRGAGLVFSSFGIGTAERVAASLAQEFIFRKLTPKARDLN